MNNEVDFILSPLKNGDHVQHVMSICLHDAGLSVVCLHIEAGYCEYHQCVELQATIGNNGKEGGDDVHQ